MSWLCRLGLHKWRGSPARLTEVCLRCHKTRTRRGEGGTGGNPGFLIWR